MSTYLRYRRVGRRHTEDSRLPPDFDAPEAVVEGGVSAGAAGHPVEVKRVLTAATIGVPVVVAVAPSDSLEPHQVHQRGHPLELPRPAHRAVPSGADDGLHGGRVVEEGGLSHRPSWGAIQ